MYTVVGSPQSRALRVLWMLEEMGLPYSHVAAPPGSEDVIAVNPAGKVPVLIIEGVPILDSTAILAFLGDKHRALTHTAGTLERARQDSMTQFLLDELDSALWMAARHSFILPEALRQSSIKDSLKWEFSRSLKILAGRMSDGPFVMGDEMTIPDIILTHCGNWAKKAGFPIEVTRVADYLERMMARPALARALGTPVQSANSEP